MKVIRILLFTLGVTLLATACKTEKCACPATNKKHYKQYSEVPANMEVCLQATTPLVFT